MVMSVKLKFSIILSVIQVKEQKIQISPQTTWILFDLIWKIGGNSGSNLILTLLQQIEADCLEHFLNKEKLWGEKI